MQGDHQRYQPGSDSSQHQSVHPHDPTGIGIYAPTLGPAQGMSSYISSIHAYSMHTSQAYESFSVACFRI